MRFPQCAESFSCPKAACLVDSGCYVISQYFDHDTSGISSSCATAKLGNAQYDLFLSESDVHPCGHCRLSPLLLEALHAKLLLQGCLLIHCMKGHMQALQGCMLIHCTKGQMQANHLQRASADLCVSRSIVLHLHLFLSFGGLGQRRPTQRE